jgi:hypothetical protein
VCTIAGSVDPDFDRRVLDGQDVLSGFKLAMRDLFDKLDRSLSAHRPRA